MIWVSRFFTSPIFGIALRPQGGAAVLSLVPMGILVTLMSLEGGVESFLIPLLSRVEIKMDPAIQVLLICRGVLFVYALPNITSANVSFIAGDISICGVVLITEILGFVGRGKIDTSPMVQSLNNFGPKFRC